MKKPKNKDISVPDLLAAVFFWMLTAAWIVMIFYLSSENGTDSYERSGNALKYLELFFGENVLTDTLLRKIIHVIEYAVLTIFTFFAARYTNRISFVRSYAESPVKLVKSDNEMYIALTLWMSLLTAVVDEYHQLFVDGRDGSIRDVLIDSIGIIIVLIIIRIIFTIYLRYLGRKEVRYE